MENLNKRGLTVIIFFDMECPVCKLYSNTLSQLSSSYPEFIWQLVLPGQVDTTNAVKFFTEICNFQGNVIYDPENLLKDKYNAVTTPQVFIRDKKNQIRYSGKIDNRVKKLGNKQNQATAFYLKDALEAIKKEEQVQIKITKPIGCLIQ